jgi:hypothetical protein
LQRRLLSFIRDLPVSKVGAWAAASCGTSFTDATVAAEFTVLLRSWSEQNGNKILQVSAYNVLKQKKCDRMRRWHSEIHACLAPATPAATDTRSEMAAKDEAANGNDSRAGLRSGKECKVRE